MDSQQLDDEHLGVSDTNSLNANRSLVVDNLYAYNTFDKANLHLYTYSLLIASISHCEKVSMTS